MKDSVVHPGRLVVFKVLSALALLPSFAAAAAPVLGTGDLGTYIDEFRADDRWYFNVATDEEVSDVGNGTYGGQFIKNAGAFDYLKDRIPLLDVPDGDIEKTYYYRWWTFRKHIKNLGTAAAPNRIVTEFIDPVDWADTTNAISAPSGHHLYEGRWLDDPDLMRDYIRYWMTNPAANPRRYSDWLADGVLARQKVVPDDALISEIISSPSSRLDLERNWLAWMGGTKTPGGERQVAYYDPADGMFWQNDDRDAMEFSYGGSGKRPSINSYLYGDAHAIAEMFRIAANAESANASQYLASASQFDTRAAALRTQVQGDLWDPASEFFKTGYGPNGSRPPVASQDYGIRRHTWWSPDHLGTTEWLEYDLAAPVTLDRTEIYFFDDQGYSGVNRVPAQWVFQYWDGSTWVDLSSRDGGAYTTNKNAFNVVQLPPVTATKVRVQAVQQPGLSAGTLEWRVFSTDGKNAAFTATASASYTDAVGGTLLALNDERPDGYNQQARRELIGLTPWYFELPEDGGAVDYDKAWSHLSSFDTPYGLTSGALDETGYYAGALGGCCQWNGPIWPFATSVTLTAMAHLLQDYQQPYLSRNDYLSRLTTYSLSQRFTLSRDGEQRTMCWIDETLAGSGWAAGLWSHIGGNGLSPGTSPRGFAYNHSTFADLVITGLIGLKPRSDSTVEVDPLIPINPAGNYLWNYFCMDRIPYHGMHLTILYDADGTRYRRGAGLSIFADGIRIANSPKAGKLKATLPAAVSKWANAYVRPVVAASELEPDADADGDGFTNATEYAFGTDPLSASSQPAVQTSFAIHNGVGSITLTATLRDDVTAVSYVPEFSTDLVNWMPGAFEESAPRSVGDGMSLHSYRCTLTDPTARRGFVRLRTSATDSSSGQSVITAWAASYVTADPTAQNLDGAADPDGDGYSNAVEYLFGTDPLSATSRPDVETTVTVRNGVPVMTMKIAVRNDATGVTFQPEYSTDLRNWTTVPFVELPSQPTGEGMTVHSFVCAGGSPLAAAGFMRLKVLEAAATPLPNNVEAWAVSYFPEMTPGASLSGSSDPDGDGFSNAAEYLFGTDPSSAGSKPVIQTSTGIESGVAILTVKVALRDDATAVTGYPEYSVNLVDWDTSGFVESLPEPLGGSLSLHTYRLVVPGSPLTPSFVRFHVTEL